jgi:hypothetical protein
MKNKLYNILSVLAFCVVFTACQNELDIAKLGNLGSETDFYKTDADAEKAIACCYYNLYSNYSNIMSAANLLSDDIWCGGGSRGDLANNEDIGAYAFSTNNQLVENLYSGLYTQIYNANLVLGKFSAYDTDTKKRDKAEAYFFRGMAHFYLGAFFGTAPVVNHLLATNEYAQKNSTQQQLYEQATSDFKAAIEMGALSSKTSANQKIARVTQEAAYSYLGKSYVFLGKWSDAANAFENVITSQKYQLYQGNYGDIIRMVTDFGSENILEGNMVWDSALAWNFTFANWYCVQHGWRANQHNWAGKKAEYADLSSGGYGFYNPRKSVYDAFVAEEGTDGYRLNQTIKTYDQIKNDIGVTISAGQRLHGHEGYYNWKNRLVKSELIFGNEFFSCVNLRYMRYAEVLLLAAEANLKAGNTSKAIDYVNQVRIRAKLAPKSTITLDDIKTEKRLELFEEGCRFLDLVRWGDAATVLKDQGKVNKCFDGTSIKDEYTNTASTGFVKGKNEFLPIPEKEMTLNENMIQNAGWK